jgi:small GTP-binding protein
MRTLKYIFVGDSGCGKSALQRRFTHGDFDENYDMTIGVEYAVKMVLGGTVKLQLWDCAGFESFRSLTRAYYRGAHVVLLVFDVSNRQSFESVETWIKEVRYEAPEALLVLVGSKTDLIPVVTEAEAQTLAAQHGLEYCPVSAKTDHNVTNLFVTTAEIAKPAIREIGAPGIDLTAKPSWYQRTCRTTGSCCKQ